VLCVDGKLPPNQDDANHRALRSKGKDKAAPKGGSDNGNSKRTGPPLEADLGSQPVSVKGMHACGLPCAWGKHCTPAARVASRVCVHSRAPTAPAPTHSLTHSQDELVLAEATLPDGSASQIIFIHEAKVGSDDLEQLCVKVGGWVGGWVDSPLPDATAASLPHAHTHTHRSAGPRLNNPRASSLFHPHPQVGWPARPLAKVQLALQNSYLVCSLVLRISRPQADGSMQVRTQHNAVHATHKSLHRWAHACTRGVPADRIPMSRAPKGRKPDGF
jgi:hypothetical protein